MANFWDSLGETAKSLGGALIAPAGVVWDVASAPIDNKDDSIGSVLNDVAGRFGDMLDPLGNEKTWTGALFGNVMHGLDVAYREAISEPWSAVTIMGGKMRAGSDNWWEREFLGGDWSVLFNQDNWAEAYKRAQHQSIGQGAAYQLLHQQGENVNDDPFNYDRPYAETVLKDHPTLGSLVSGTADFTMRWYFDPGVLLGHAAAGYKNAVTFKRLDNMGRENLYDKMTGEMASGALGLKGILVPKSVKSKLNFESRTDSYLRFINGENVLGKNLNGAEIYAATPELRRSSAGRSIASLLADAQKLDHPADVANAQRRILAVAGGDELQVIRIRNEQAEAGAIADALDNIRKGGTLDLELQALSPSITSDPAFVANLERQLGNLNSSGQIDNFVNGWMKQMDALKETQGKLDFLPGAHPAGDRALKRETHQRFIDKTAEADKAIKQKARDWASFEAASNVYQKSWNTVPLVVVKTAGMFTSPYTRWPRTITDALRQTHYVGVANLHDWNSSVTQLDSMMRMAKVDDTTRLAMLSDAMKASAEPEKLKAIAKVENLSLKTLAADYSQRLGRDIDTDYVQALMAKGIYRRNQHLTALRGRTYAATEMGDDMLATRRAGLEYMSDSMRFNSVPEDAVKWRVDHFNDDGVALAMPLLETQLANSVPLLDMHLATTVMSRQKNVDRLGDLADAWRSQTRMIDGLEARLKNARPAAAERLQKALEKAYMGWDFLIDAGQIATRFWKFSVLFRLGYPTRVLMDDHMRIWSQLNAMTFYGRNGREAAENLVWNTVARRKAGAAELGSLKADLRRLHGEYGYDKIHSTDDFKALTDAIKTVRGKKTPVAAKTEAQKVIDRLDPEGTISQVYHRKIDIERARKQVVGKTNAIKKWKAILDTPLGATAQDAPAIRQKIKDAEDFIEQKTGAIDFLSAQQPSALPEEIRKQIEGLSKTIDAGAKPLRPAKRHIGQKDVVMEDGTTFPGAFAGEAGAATRLSASSDDTFRHQISGVEDRYSGSMGAGAWQTLTSDSPGHLDAWADVLNHQFRQSRISMFFVKNPEATPADFVKWIREPEQTDLRERLSYLAHDPEDWAHRVKALVNDYLPTDELREQLASGPVSSRRLAKMFPDMTQRPAVHGQVAAFNIGNNFAVRAISDTLNRVYKFLGELPTDHLSRHPYFSALYNSQVESMYARRKVALDKLGQRFTESDVTDITRAARAKAMSHMKQTLFDISAHSHAAHVMRFISPFFAAHQESLMRWWRIARDNPAVIRRFQQAFDMPRKMGLVYDSETGEPVGDGEGISANHRILIRVPDAFGGERNPIDKWLKKMGGDRYWSVNENGFNLVLQGGLMNPGVGPVVSVPVEALVEKYAQYDEFERAARILNPYQPDSALDSVTPAAWQRAFALARGEKSAEFAQRMNANVTDAYIKFRDETGRTPSDKEMDELIEQARVQTTSDMWMLLAGNALSPVPPKPESKYAVVQHGWRQIQERARAEDRDYQWMIDTFRQKYGDIYLAMVYSDSINPGRFKGTHSEVGAVKKYSPILGRIDTRLARMVVGPEVDDTEEYSGASRQWLEGRQVRPGSTETFIGTKDPRERIEATAVREGWDAYSTITGALTAVAQQRGLGSYEEDPELVQSKRDAVAKLMEDNVFWAKEYQTINSGDYNAYVDDMRQIVKYKSLANDPGRGDIQMLKTYLDLRDAVQARLKQLRAIGEPYTAEAQANAPLMQAFAAVVSAMAEENPYFQQYSYDGLIEFDPFVKAGQVVTTSAQ